MRSGWLWLFCGLVWLGCSEETPSAGTDTSTPPVAEDTMAPDSSTPEVSPDSETPPPTCDAAQLPIVALHGMLGSGDNYAPHAMRFAANGLCEGYFRAYDWDSLTPGGDVSADLDAAIDALLEETGHTQVHLMGHSAGGGVSYTYLEEATRAAKVARYVHIGSFRNNTLPGPNADLPTLNLWSEGDLVISGKGDIAGATNVMLTTEDHMSVATSPASFAAIFEFFNGRAPEHTELVPQTPLTTAGRVVTLGDNVPQSGDIDLYAFDATTGERSEGGLTIPIGDGGYFGPIDLAENTHYEYVLNSVNGARPIHYFRTPQVRPDHLNYLRDFPTTGLASLLMSMLNFDDQSTTLVVFSSTRGLVAGQDSLKINGEEVLNEETANAENTSIAFFFYDKNGDQTTTKEVVALPGNIPFLVMMDVFIDATTGTPITVELNGETVALPALKSHTEGPAILVLSP